MTREKVQAALDEIVLPEATWSLWKGLMDANGIIIRHDDSGVQGPEITNRSQVVDLVMKCDLSSPVREALSGRR